MTANHEGAASKTSISTQPLMAYLKIKYKRLRVNDYPGSGKDGFSSSSSVPGFKSYEKNMIENPQ